MRHALAFALMFGLASAVIVPEESRATPYGMCDETALPLIGSMLLFTGSMLAYFVSEEDWQKVLAGAGAVTGLILVPYSVYSMFANIK